jgi:cytochrome c oxidase subunit 4
MSEHVEPVEQAELVVHPTPRRYVAVAVALAAITAFEVAVYYIESAHSILVPTLIVFAFLKFFLVVSWFMHLRFDSKLFRNLFVTGLILALVVFGVVLATIFGHVGGPGPNVGG